MALNPHQKNKVDITALSEEEQKLFRLYGKLPNKKDLFSKKLQERKYFDSGDYAMSKAGKSDVSVLDGGLGRAHPSPNTIPHLSQQLSQSSGTSTASGGGSGGTNNNNSGGNSVVTGGFGPGLQPTLSGGQSGSPVKESSFLQRGMSVDEQDSAEIETAAAAVTASSPPRGGGATAASRAGVGSPMGEKGIPIRK